MGATSGQIIGTGGYQGRVVRLDWNIKEQSVSGNWTDINWTLKGYGGSSEWIMSGNFKVVLDGATVYSSSSRIQLLNGTVIASGVKRLQHNADGTRAFSGSIEAGIYYTTVNCTGSNDWLLKEIPKGAILTGADNFSDEDEVTSITYNNPVGNSVTSLQLAINLNGTNVIPYRDISKTGNSYILYFTDAERSLFRSTIVNSKTAEIRYNLKTVLNGEIYYDSLYRTFAIVNANPVINGLAYKDGNTSVTAITNDNTVIVQNKSSLVFTFSDATFKKGATLASYKLDINGQSYTAASGSKSITVGTINNSNNIPYTFKVTDSRGNVATQTGTVEMTAYEVPAIEEIILGRVSNYYNETHLKVKANYSSVGNKNVVTVKYKYKIAGADAYGTEHTTTNDTTEILELDNSYAYEFLIYVTDSFTTSATGIVKKVNAGVPVQMIDTKKLSIGINCLPSHDKALEVVGDIYLNGEKIIDSGSNYIKFTDGTMIEWLYVETDTQTISNAYGSLFQGSYEWSFPIAFISIPSVACSQFKYGSSASWGSVADTTTTKVNLRGIDAFSRDSGTTCKISAIAIGRWKTADENN